MSEPPSADAPSAATGPRLRLVGMHIRGLRAIKEFDLPRDGLGWRGEIPNLILLAGINGSGKTTLLNFIASCLGLLRLSKPGQENDGADLATVAEASDAWVEFEVKFGEEAATRMRFVVGESEYVDANRTETCWLIYRRNTWEMAGTSPNMSRVIARIRDPYCAEAIPSVVLLPSDNRFLNIPAETYKSGGKLIEEPEFVHRWRPPAVWKESLEAFLYSLRWEDLNAKEEGRLDDAHHFASYAEAFHRLTDERKSLAFEGGKLVVRIDGSSVVHDLSELSSGERQLLVLTGELLRYWRPGSLILIDEPELHLHTRWQTRLYDSLRHWQKERGGQIILATQSAHLVELAGPGTAALMGMEPL